MATKSTVLLLTMLFIGTAPAMGNPTGWPEYTDAEYLALEISGELLPPPAMVMQIDADLQAVRAYDPFFEGIHVFPHWLPGVLLVGLTSDAWEQYDNGKYHGLDSLNAEYGPVEIDQVGGLHVLDLTFEQIYHPLVLGPIYAQAEGVRYAEPNGIAGDGNDIESSEVGFYKFRLAWGDCPAGCKHEHVWVFQVDDGEVTLLDAYGEDPPSPIQPASWGRTKTVWR